MSVAGLTGSTMISFRAGDLVEELGKRGSSSQVGAICRRDLRRYYWVMAVSLASAPAIAEESWAPIARRVAAARSCPTADGDLTAVVYALSDLLPGWSAVQLLALADRLEHDGGWGEPALVIAAPGSPPAR